VSGVYGGQLGKAGGQLEGAVSGEDSGSGRDGTPGVRAPVLRPREIRGRPVGVKIRSRGATGRVQDFPVNRKSSEVEREVSPEGVTPEGVAPEGVATEGVAPEGVAPEGVATEGAALVGVATSVSSPSSSEIVTQSILS